MKTNIGSLKNALFRYSPSGNRIQFLCDEKGDIKWFGPLQDIFHFMYKIQKKGAPYPKHLYAVSSINYMQMQSEFAFAAKGIGLINGAGARLLNRQHVFPIKLDHPGTIMAFPALIPVIRDMQEQANLLTSPKQAVQLARKVQELLKATSPCTSCGQGVCIPSFANLATTKAENGQLVHSDGAEYEEMKSRGHRVFCIYCASLIMCEIGTYKTNAGQCINISKELFHLRSAVNENEIKNMIPLLNTVVNALGSSVLNATSASNKTAQEVISDGVATALKALPKKDAATPNNTANPNKDDTTPPSATPWLN